MEFSSFRFKDIFVIPSFVRQIVYGVLDGKETVELTTGDVSIIRDFTDVRDVVRAYDLLLQQGEAGEVYNVCSGRGLPLSDILQLIAGKLQARVSMTVDPALVRPNDNMIIIGNNSKLRERTGWQPEHSLESTLDDMIAYWKGQYAQEKATHETQH